ncbi:hypothetical protein EEL30_27270 [Brevibacillus laterosporus]|uniref:Uncharacterized protein n=1 Tax=Brevibacillus laterosporus TaxID=1465 RepID=A0A518VF56_BRELA|nr:hypothetical protein EEL30_27270 [Brevibacillus laterosporus]
MFLPPQYNNPFFHKSNFSFSHDSKMFFVCVTIPVEWQDLEVVGELQLHIPCELRLLLIQADDRGE